MKRTLLLLFSTILIATACERRTLEYHDSTAVIEDRFEKNSKVIEKSQDGDVHEFLVVYVKRDAVYIVTSVTHWPSCKYCSRTSAETECLTPDLIRQQMSTYNQQLKQIQSQLIVQQLLPKYNE